MKRVQYFLCNVIALTLIVWAIWQDMRWGLMLLIPFLLLSVFGFFLMIMQFLAPLFVIELPFVPEGVEVRKFAAVMAMGFLMIGFSLAAVVIFHQESVSHYAPAGAIVFLVPATITTILVHIREQKEAENVLPKVKGGSK